MTSIEFQFVGPDNPGVLDRIADDVFDEDIKPQSLAAFIGDTRHMLIVALDLGVVVGMAAGAELFQPDKAPQFFINEVGVAASHRRRGIGRRLVAMMLDAARARGCECAWVGTETDNDAANALYRSTPGSSAPQTFVLYEWRL